LRLSHRFAVIRKKETKRKKRKRKRKSEKKRKRRTKRMKKMSRRRLNTKVLRSIRITADLIRMNHGSREHISAVTLYLCGVCDTWYNVIHTDVLRTSVPYASGYLRSTAVTFLSSTLRGGWGVPKMIM
jgi:Flp pilus assembly protein TadB